jgi:phospholipid transport system substrate-binding protein
MVLLLTCPAARAGSPTEELRALFAGATRILDPRTPDGPEERLNAVRVIVREIVDFREAARLSLGPMWNARTPAERDEFVPLFADFLERALITGIAGKIRLADGVKVSYLGEVVDGAAATVWTTIASKSGLDLPLSYRMIERRGRWAIRDVVIDGVSLAANYRAQLLRVMQTSSYPELIMQMRSRVAGGTGASLASAISSDLAFGSIGPAPPAPAIERAQRAPAEAIARDEVAERSPEPPAQDLAEGGRSEPPSRLELDLTLLARALPEPAVVVPKSTAPSASAGEETAPAPRQTRGRTQPLPATTAPTRAAAGASSSAAKSYWVQVGAFKSLEAARRLASLLLDEEAPSRPSPFSVVVEPASADAPLARVRVGPFPDRWAAAAKVREIQARGHQPFVAAPERD